MTEASPAEHAVQRIRAIAAELTAAGLHTQIHQTRASADLTATAHPAGFREIEATVDEDGYVELRYWQEPDAAPAQVSGTITRAIEVITHAR